MLINLMLLSSLDGEDDSGLLERSTNGAADASTLDETRHKRNKQRAYMHFTNELLVSSSVSQFHRIRQ